MDTTIERARRGALLGLAAGVFCIQWDAFALNLALPQIRHELDAGGTGAQWVVSSYLLTTGMLMLGAGRLADLFGRRRLFVLGLVVFGAASTLCALAWSLPALVAFRAVQGVGASVIMPAGLSLVTHVYAGHRPGRAIGWALGLGGAATACGPVAGGWLTEALSWRAVFWLNVPLTALAVLWSRRAAESRDDGTPRHLDWPGLLTATAGLGALALFLDRGSGWPLLPALGTPAAAVLLLVLFARIQRDSPHPVVRLALFRNLPYVVLTLTGAVANTALVLLLFLVPLSLQSEWGLPAGEAGAAFLAPTAAIALAGPLAGRVPPRRAAPVTAACLTVGAVALGGLAGGAALGRYELYLASAVVGGAAFGTANALALVVTQQIVEPGRAGEASGVTKTVITVAAGLGVTLSGAATQRSGPSQTGQAALTALAADCLAAALATAAWHFRAARRRGDTHAPEDGTARPWPLRGRR
ncbi:MFS transporter [Streptomyces sp. NRRL F-5053]|uniref:MFS transporter n=1 Tax=Streptomyces sp. NRRL F-5053 TaxID=1463854 RepID=UPI0004C4B4F4|nr:MFS transporter [Streptomyces sp. NRRL F-5053]